MARLLIFDEAVRGVDVPVHPVVIGRSRKTDIPIHDALLSRKHCSIVPLEGGYRLLDLRSANGTFVNGVKVDKAELSYDDVIEIGNTVVVFVDTQNPAGGCELARLRNPEKARELIERVSRLSLKELIEGVSAGRSAALRKPSRVRSPRGHGKKAASLVAALLSELGDGARSRGELALVEEYILYDLVVRLARPVSQPRKVVCEVVERLLENNPLPEDLAELRRRIGALVAETVAQDTAPVGAARDNDGLGGQGSAGEETSDRAGGSGGAGGSSNSGDDLASGRRAD